MNALTRALETLRADGAVIVDLTESNPTRAGIPYPRGLLDALADERATRYEPHPLGLPSAREAVAADQRRRGAKVDPAHVVLTASTSEAYGWLFKLLCNPGESVLVPCPSYPLFEHLARLEGIRAEPYALDYHGRWMIDSGALANAPDDTRALVVVSPNNPTGSYVKEDELWRLAAICRERRWALVADEVFADYALDAETPLTDLASRSEVLAFTLAGLSKTVGLPQVKLGWIVVGGPPADRAAALSGLELVADTYLSSAMPVQLATPELLRAGMSVRSAIQDRIRRNLRTLRAATCACPACEVLSVEGGWSAVVRVPSTRDEERLVVDLLERERILVYPGYFFNFPREAYLVVSLLPPASTFTDASARLLRFVSH